MKNKRLLAVLAVLVVLVGGSLIYSSPNKDGKANPTTDKKTVKVGVLQYVSHPSLDLIYKGIQEGLAEEGYKADDIEIDFMNAEGDQSKVATMSKQLVSNDNDVLIGIATPSAQGLAAATKDKPIVMGAITDPVGANLVKNLEKPGGNITGVSDHNPAKQQLELIKKLTPNVKTIGALYSSSEDNSKTQVEEFKKLAEEAGYKVEEYSVPSTNEIASTMNVMTGKVDAIWIPIDNTIASAFATVVSSNKDAKKPIYPSATAMVEEGGLASVVVDQHDLGVATGKMAAKILKGAKPEETPVEIFNQGKSVINKKNAKELGITLPDDVLKEAGQVIE
ncbi:tryptophan ABC transporter substrate-binding protein [Streptococcus gordonii]|mgnify:FL=1|uniref:tryptophan ABC transporter substrate-binding protein n=1 Tax=Streptococcus gordonii TaxID=1302 RepID=UPI000779EC80|nr:tryptophan ABC transporter substrate-binding protein [Streptococcus gordonii]MCB6585112.1 ABC transporter substrate-binding protein [Streptococcus gordonii]MCB7054229.1 ABC transporter substrate-binding protein [Streptococcus gordonii]MCB7056316.1 ABC transporter substrate-binding protein [Streptococcus gordonii]MCG4823597.1 ABC transporter substrate-binding protein [Streptococcus gordonii]MCG4842787.1 ABC transporter substrate-binding protein [Streptococcus gordonii]